MMKDFILVDGMIHNIMDKCGVGGDLGNMTLEIGDQMHIILHIQATGNSALVGVGVRHIKVACHRNVHRANVLLPTR
jgi:hypothetical protein